MTAESEVRDHVVRMGRENAGIENGGGEGRSGIAATRGDVGLEGSRPRGSRGTRAPRDRAGTPPRLSSRILSTGRRRTLAGSNHSAGVALRLQLRPA
jgi:hypothetical protein